MTSRPMHLAAHFPGVNNTTVWAEDAQTSPPPAGPGGRQIAFSSFTHLARTAERGLFDFFFLAEGLRLREHQGRIHDLDVVGRPESLTVLTALAATTERLGLAATVNATFNEPYELARRLATLDHLSAGRAAWNVVTSFDAFTGENFRRGGFLDRADRYTRAAEFVATARALWDAAAPDGAGQPVTHTGQHFGIEGRFGLPRSPQGHPVVIQAGDSPEGREFAAAAADVIFTRHGTLEAGRAFYTDVKDRLPAHGRRPEELKIMPGVTFVLGDTDAEAQENAVEIRRRQISPQNALYALEQIWGIDLSGHDPDGPLPEADPDVDSTFVQGRVKHGDPRQIAEKWRALSAEKGLSSRETVIEATGRQSFVGTPAAVAEQMISFVDRRAADGFILVPHLTPDGLDPFVDRVVPILQERGAFRTEYTGTTLRDHLGLPAPRPRTEAGRG
ncbi:NtaA/DmoA family FMN-dependent monooxygenase [Streptomyces albidoflavus]|jgi:FMN-dependent oxidoreductase (nitrilotriacetate monooxygenase family)|uniref:Oxygenase n=1 Tax=Streptomyces albidoflavus TaxID=1886 RepID=A0AA37C2D3_9ACTN|nr:MULTISPECIES: NtaA/DmoA family FMN-dependent monooxygenase [Streptomyces]MBO1283583.1 NtaA/DmoA family FMN-dependent monooxygenase [Streptomyces sampsonii]MYW58315.1 NtaA/DmoA family FMN-dependent monooxygenase [Streptomyces sp. SID8370]MYW87689.1 NtaA/DmoA family FMN-dependent monooxygenase [Streptomyces sp. SID8371]NUW07355.1 NtaA/DmoA family FMN-dependent monooxygenase [Streptomyces sp. CAI-21]NVI28956.1 NtaA/DmoA family FMN-dependent monooxygenase [Streptomyces sp. CAI-17]SCD50569.1 FM